MSIPKSLLRHNFSQAKELVELAKAKGLYLSVAPCNSARRNSANSMESSAQ